MLKREEKRNKRTLSPNSHGSEASCWELGGMDTHSRCGSREKRPETSVWRMTRLSSRGTIALPRMDKKLFTVKERARCHPIMKLDRGLRESRGSGPPGKKEMVMPRPLRGAKDTQPAAELCLSGWGRTLETARGARRKPREAGSG